MLPTGSFTRSRCSSPVLTAVTRRWELARRPPTSLSSPPKNNSVYAFEAPPFPPSGGGMCWQIKLNNVGETAIPYTDLPTQCENLLPQVGITGTPVIDVTVTPPILYVVTS